MKKTLFEYFLQVLTCTRGSMMSGGGEGDDPPADSAPPAGDGGGAPEISWPGGLEEEYHGDKTLLKHYDHENKQFKTPALMKALVHATRVIGKDKTALPDSHWTDEQYTELYHKLGLPKEIEKYEVSNNLAEGITANEELFNGFKEVAYANGILPKQAQPILDFYNNKISEQIKAQQEQYKTELAENKAILEKEYGNAFDRKMQVAEQGAKAFADDETFNRMRENGLFDDPDFVRYLVKVGEGLGEDKFNDRADKSGSMTPSELDDEIAKFHQPHHPFTDHSHPEHQKYMDRYIRLQEMKLKANGQTNKVVIG